MSVKIAKSRDFACSKPHKSAFAAPEPRGRRPHCVRFLPGNVCIREECHFALFSEHFRNLVIGIITAVGIE